MRIFAGRGLGKVILCGEHAVVYGHPAIAVAVNRGLTISLRPRPGPVTLADADARLRAALDQVLPPEGFEVTLHSELPIGRGMGSSAAFSVALIRAYAQAQERRLSPEALFEAALQVERIFHGNPSGLDNAISAQGGVLQYRRGPPPSFQQHATPSWPLVVLDSGAAGDTAALVAHVASQRPVIDPILERIGELSQEVVTHLYDVETLGPLLTENHRLLKRIGVSTPELDALVDFALGAGAHGAKLSGAGGGGIVIALTSTPQPLLTLAVSRGIKAFVVYAERLR